MVVCCWFFLERELVFRYNDGRDVLEDVAVFCLLPDSAVIFLLEHLKVPQHFVFVGDEVVVESFVLFQLSTDPVFS